MAGRLNSILGRMVGTQALVWCQLQLRLSIDTEREPVLMLLTPRADFCSASHPTAADVLLLIEVSNTTPPATAASSRRCMRATA